MKKHGSVSLLVLALFFLCQCSGKETIREGHGISVPSGMIVSAHPEASRIGTAILREGGNAVDAAVATEFALAVCYPEAGNIGGGGFMVIRLADGKTDVIDYREKAPLLASRDMFLDSSGNVVPGLSTASHVASGVPGTVDGMINAHSHYGRMPFSKVIQPAIDLASKGFRITKSQADDLNMNRQEFIERNASLPAFVKDSLWKEGDILVQKDLARTLERISENGREGFYSGETAGMLVSEMKRGKGLISEEDLNNYKSVNRNPLTGEYKGYRIITVPPPSSGGIILLQLLGMIRPYPVSEWGFDSSRTVHLMAEAERRAFADRAEYMGDPDYMKVPATALVNEKYLESRMTDFNSGKASLSSDIHPGSPVLKESDQTTHYSVVDADGNAVSATTTLNGTFGNSVVVDGAGFLLNNEMDDFSIKPGFPNMYGVMGGEANSVAPGKKMLSSMTPVIVEKEGKLFLVAGSPGGSTIPTTVFQIVTNVIDFGMDVQAAVDAGRFHHQWLPDQIIYEKNRIDPASLNVLTSTGHKLAERNSIGRVSAIMILENGRKSGGADRRGDNIAYGY
ncbi:MAG TPA: gamma-glutamyltransferase [Bacteroidales bacterium]|nr:gamma-glutamyltransferase [Bacteroidales bacterium]